MFVCVVCFVGVWVFGCVCVCVFACSYTYPSKKLRMWSSRGFMNFSQVLNDRVTRINGGMES